MSETNTQQIEQDLAFVKDAIRRRQAEAGLPLPIALVLGLLCLVGFPVADFAVRYVWHFWAIASPLWFVLCMLLGWRFARQTGELDWAEGRRHILHWAGVLAAWLVVFLGAALGIFRGPAIGPTILLVLALGYYLAGIHLARICLWLGLLMAAGAVVLMFVHQYVMTVLGVLLCVGFIVPPLVRKFHRG